MCHIQSFLFLVVIVFANTFAFAVPGNGRQTYFLNEPQLTPEVINVTSFGLITRFEVLGRVVAQPLIVDNEKTQDPILVVATLQNYLYAFNARTYNLNWKIWFGIPCWHLVCTIFGGPIGILSTPVINETTGHIYLVARVCQQDNNATSGNNETGEYYIHTISLTTGEKLISRLLTGTHRNFTFSHELGLQRVSLTLSNNILYFATASFCDIGYYRGWIFAYNASNLQLLDSMATTYFQGGCWQAGAPLLLDSDDTLYAVIGNGKTNISNEDYGTSLLKLKLKNEAEGVWKWNVLDYFIPSEHRYLEHLDLDLYGAPLFSTASPDLILVTGKSGMIYVCNQSNLGQLSAEGENNSQIVQFFQVSKISPYCVGTDFCGGYGLPSMITWGRYLYTWAELDPLKQFIFDPNVIKYNPIPIHQGTIEAFSKGGILSLSVNETNLEGKGVGVLWVNMPFKHVFGTTWEFPAILRAYDASNISRLLWDSEMNHIRDAPGNYSKYIAPLIHKGKVYLASGSNQVLMYGLYSQHHPSQPNGTLRNFSDQWWCLLLLFLSCIIDCFLL